MPFPRRTASLRHALLGTLSLLAVTLAVAPASAQTLQEALARAYETNPTLEAARAQLRAFDENVPIARSGFLPQVTVGADATRQRIESTTPTLTGTRDIVDVINPRSVDLSVVQPLYQGGRVVAAISRAENLVQAQRSALVATEQAVLLDAATRYLDVLRDQAVLELNANLVQVLSRQLEAAQDRFRVGEITRTDVSQSESRLAGAIFGRIQSQGILDSTRAAYVEVIGAPPGELVQPVLSVALPATLDEAIALAERNSPNVIAAQFSERAAGDAISEARAELRPDLTLSGAASRSWSGRGDESFGSTDSLTVRAGLNIPLYQGGAEYARLRQAKKSAGQSRIEVDEALRDARSAAVQSWTALVTARATIESTSAQVRSAEIALEGVRQEATVGARTVLDVLDAEQELLNARVQLVDAQRDELVASFQVLAATGQMTAQRIALPVSPYDYDAHYRRVRNKLIGTGGE